MVEEGTLVANVFAPKVTVEIDRSADAAYVRLSDGAVARTEALGDMVLVDLDSYGVVVGVEVLGLNTVLPLADLEKRFHVHSDVIGVIDSLRPTISYAWSVAVTTDSVSTPAQNADLVRC